MTKLITFLVVILVSILIPSEAGWTKFWKKVDDKIISGPVKKLIKHLNGESDCKHNCQIAQDYSACFDRCRSENGFSFMVDIAKIKF